MKKYPKYSMTLTTRIIMFQSLQWNLVRMKHDLLMFLFQLCMSHLQYIRSCKHLVFWLSMTACTFIMVSQFSYTDVTVLCWRSSPINAIGDLFFLAQVDCVLQGIMGKRSPPPQTFLNGDLLLPGTVKQSALSLQRASLKPQDPRRRRPS